MGITDWDQWMKEYHIYIPSAEEVERARKNNEVKVRKLREELEDAGKALEEYKEKVQASQ